MRTRLHDLGRRAYLPTLALQEQLREQVRARPEDGAHLIIVEHDPPVITLGRRTRAEHFLVKAEQLRARGVELHASARGGAMTWHGPGQIAAYPILRLSEKRSLRAHIRGMEEAVIATLAQFGVCAQRIPGLTGVWVNGEKIAAIGVAVSHWIAWHGLALNVNPSLDAFRWFIPCGIEDKGVTSLARCLNRDLRVEEAKPVLAANLAKALELNLEITEPPAGAPHDPPRRHEMLPGAPLVSRHVQSVGDFSRRNARASSPPTANVARQSAPLPPRPRMPPWLRRPIPPAGDAAEVRAILAELKLPTVCVEARCPNIHECFGRRTATFMILGDLCTRSCRFCSVARGRPLPPREEEPAALAEACARLRLRHVVITSVTRDDLADGGATHFARTIRAVKGRLPAARVEVLTPDFRGATDAVDLVLDAAPEVFSHNLETVARLQRSVRGKANYAHSLAVLAHAARRAAERNGHSFAVKSGLMLGLGESFAEALDAVRDLRAAGCTMLTVGQYLPPSPRHAPAVRFAAPAEFDAIAREARAIGFSVVAAGPFVRSSYLAEETYAEESRRAFSIPK